jgi:putative transcriptional regulator
LARILDRQRENQKMLSPKEVRFLRGQMEKTQAEVATLLRVDDQTIARWEKGKVKLSGTADIAFRMLFLGSRVAQPEGAEILTKLIETIRRLIEQDAPISDDVRFIQHNHNWEMQRVYAVG